MPVFYSVGLFPKKMLLGGGKGRNTLPTPDNAFSFVDKGLRGHSIEAIADFTAHC